MFYKELRKEIAELKKGIGEVRDVIRELKLEIIKLKYPPKYKIGESYPDIDNVKGGIIYDVKLGGSTWHRSYQWQYYILQGTERRIMTDKTFYD